MAKAALVIHDDSGLRKLLRVRLENDGVQVLEAGDRRLAMEIYKTHPGQIGVVVSGVRMKGVDVGTLLDDFRKADPSVPFFLFTSHAPDLDLAKTQAIRVFGKPEGLNDLLQSVREVLSV